MSKTLLLLIDWQNDFVTGTLTVPGAKDDLKRLVSWYGLNSDSITDVISSQDYHNVDHIAHATQWRDTQGNMPAPFTNITFDDVAAGIWTCVSKHVDDKWLLDEYLPVASPITIWPEHCIAGTKGADLVDDVTTMLGSKPVERVYKGQNNKVEFFSMFGANVKDPNDPSTSLNVDLMRRVFEYDKIYISGQALSHCVASSVMDLVRYCDSTPSLAKKLHLLITTCSAVPGCAKQADYFVVRARAAGVQFVVVE